MPFGMRNACLDLGPESDSLTYIPIIANPERWQVMARLIDLLPPCGRPGFNFWFLVLTWASPSYCRHLGSEVADSLYFFLFASYMNFFKKEFMFKVAKIIFLDS